MKILLIEPDYLLASVYKQALQKAGHDINLAATAQTAITAADRAKPDLVILELQLVEHSGLEFLYEFRSYSDWQDVPVIVHSQVPSAEFAVNPLLKKELGVQIYLYKPLTSLRQLMQAIDELAPQTA